MFKSIIVVSATVLVSVVVALWIAGALWWVRGVQYAVGVPQRAEYVVPTREAVRIVTGGNLSNRSSEEYPDTVGTRSSIWFTDAERSHLRDVRDMYGVVQWVAIGALIVTVVCLLLPIPNAAGRLIRINIRRSRAVIIGGGIISLVLFSVAFTGMHELLFEPGTWMFPSDSMLIRLFPYRFWVVWWGSVVIGALAFAALLDLLASKRKDWDAL